MIVIGYGDRDAFPDIDQVQVFVNGAEALATTRETPHVSDSCIFGAALLINGAVDTRAIDSMINNHIDTRRRLAELDVRLSLSPGDRALLTERAQLNAEAIRLDALVYGNKLHILV